MIKLCREYMLKAEIGWKLQLVPVSQAVNAKEKFLMESKSVLLQWTHKWYESETALLLMWRKF